MYFALVSLTEATSRVVGTFSAAGGDASPSGLVREFVDRRGAEGDWWGISNAMSPRYHQRKNKKKNQG